MNIARHTTLGPSSGAASWGRARCRRRLPLAARSPPAPAAAATTPADAAATGAKSADNPFGVAENSAVDAVIFDGGYGTDYVAFAGRRSWTRTSRLHGQVSPTTEIAQELQPRFVGGNPPDLIDNSGANAIGFATILDQLEDLADVIDANNPEGTTIGDTLYGGVEEPGTFDGKLVALNYVLTVYALWYSASLFDENGWSRRRPGTTPSTWAPRPRRRASTSSSGARRRRPTTRRSPSRRRSRRAATRSASRSRTSTRLLVPARGAGGLHRRWSRPCRPATSCRAAPGTQFTAAQAQWTQGSTRCSTPPVPGSRTR